MILWKIVSRFSADLCNGAIRLLVAVAAGDAAALADALLALGKLRGRVNARAFLDKLSTTMLGSPYQWHLLGFVKKNQQALLGDIAWDTTSDEAPRSIWSMSTMPALDDEPQWLHIATKDVPLHEYRLRVAGRLWSILHTGAMLTPADETHFFRELMSLLPYGVALWPAAIALAHEVASRAEDFRDKRILELGAGTGLPGIVAASLGGQVVQTDRHELALSVCKRNGERNAVQMIEYRLADWTSWNDTERYDWILGSDILYGETLHPHLRRIFEANLAPGGRILLTDPFRSQGLGLLEALEASGWTISLSTWSVGEEQALRSIGLFELVPPQ